MTSITSQDRAEGTEELERERNDGFISLVARYPGKCLRCRGPIEPGETIRWRKRRNPRTGRPARGGMSYHLSSRCPANFMPAEGFDEDDGEEF